MNLSESALEKKTYVPGFKFSTEAFAQHEQFDVWCDFTASLSDLEKVEAPKSGFVASSDSYHLGSLQLATFRLPSMGFKYTSDIIRRADFDHWCVSAVTKGAVAAMSTNNSMHTAAGGTVLHSYARPFEGRMESTNFTCMFLSRDEFWDVANELDSAANLQMHGPMSHILGDFLASLEHRAEKLTVSEGIAVNEAFGSLLRAAIRQTPASLEAAKAPIAAAQFERARRFINENLKSPRLTPEMICIGIGISRRQLYYLFEQHGGVATFIRHRRLAACYNALTKTSERTLVSQIAYEYGFTNLSSFYRQFNARYGFAPSEARIAWLTGNRSAKPASTNFIDWLVRR